jgi:hypothetical protein
MRAILIAVISFMLGLAVCCQADAQTNSGVTNWFVAGYGNFPSMDGNWFVSVSAFRQTITASRRKFLNYEATSNASGDVAARTGNETNAYVSYTWHIQPRCFLFVENDFRAWCYDGNTNIWLLELSTNGFSGVYTSPHFHYSVPKYVLMQIKERSRKEITGNESWLF